jgi:hypothetical protein
MADPISIRLPDDVDERLRRHAELIGEPRSRLAGRLIDEALRMDEHPGIVFRPGPSGRRAALVRGPDVWEVLSVARRLRTKSARKIGQLCEALSLTRAEVETALRYYGAYREEIDDRIRANDGAARAAERAWRDRQRALR